MSADWLRHRSSPRRHERYFLLKRLSQMAKGSQTCKLGVNDAKFHEKKKIIHSGLNNNIYTVNDLTNAQSPIDALRTLPL